jgi:hypothetical protein
MEVVLLKFINFNSQLLESGFELRLITISFWETDVV